MTLLERIEAALKAAEEMPGYCESEVYHLSKLELRDGREALVSVVITTEEEEVEDAEIWEP